MKDAAPPNVNLGPHRISETIRAGKVKFQLSVSESSGDIKGIVLSAGSVRLQTRAWHI